VILSASEAAKKYGFNESEDEANRDRFKRKIDNSGRIIDDSNLRAGRIVVSIISCDL